MAFNNLQGLICQKLKPTNQQTKYGSLDEIYQKWSVFMRETTKYNQLNFGGCECGCGGEWYVKYSYAIHHLPCVVSESDMTTTFGICVMSGETRGEGRTSNESSSLSAPQRGNKLFS